MTGEPSLQFSVTKLPSGGFKIIAQDEKAILRAYETDAGRVIDALYQELHLLQPVVRDSDD